MAVWFFMITFSATLEIKLDELRLFCQPSLLCLRYKAEKVDRDVKQAL